jgi:hypothetical protein
MMVSLIDEAIVILASVQPERIRTSAAKWGRLAIRYERSDLILRVAGSSETTEEIVADPALRYVKANMEGVWCRARDELHALHAWVARTSYPLPAKVFYAGLDAKPTLLDADNATIVVTHCVQGNREWAAWLLVSHEAVPLDVEVVDPPATDPLPSLEPRWPLNDLTGEVAVVGAGSIGSAAALALAMYGVRRITLVDDDRLLWHNLVRHQCTRDSIGKYKVDAVAEAIRRRWPAAAVEALRLNVISDADLMRPLFRRCSLVLCAADGVAPRRVVSHLARRAEKTAVLACVLLDGAFGEVIRLRPWPGRACLLCQRAHLQSTGRMDPEPGLDSAYGTGTSHRPMTAVGTDLALVGQFAAKVAVATLLEEAGHHDQLIGLDWAVIGLRRDLTAPDPFDLHPGEVRWLPHLESLPNCPTCGAS